MNLHEFKKILNNIPSIYEETQITFICEGKIYTIESIDNIEWYFEEETNKIIDIEIKRETK